MLVISCIIDNKKGIDDEFFDYQVYKINNEFESSNIEPVEILHQGENGGSTHDILQYSGKIVSSKKIYNDEGLWRRKPTEISEQNQENQSDSN
jgi:hypothetical protein